MSQERLEELLSGGVRDPSKPSSLLTGLDDKVWDPLARKWQSKQAIREAAEKRGTKLPEPDESPEIDALEPAKEAGRALGRGLYVNLPKTAAAAGEGLASAAQRVPGPWSAPDLLKKQLQMAGVNFPLPTPLKAAQLAAGGVRQTIREAEEGGFLAAQERPGDFWSQLKADPGQTIVNGFLENAPQLAAMVGITAATGGTGGVAGAFGLEFGNAYDQAKESGANEEQATTAAILTAVPNALLERIVPASVVKRAGGSWAGIVRAVNEIGLDILKEGATESVQSLTQNLAALATYAGENGLTGNDLREAVSAKALRQYGAEGVLGMLAAGPISVAGSAVQERVGTGRGGPEGGAVQEGVEERVAERPPEPAATQEGSAEPVPEGEDSKPQVDEATRAGVEQMARVTEELEPGKVKEQTFADQRLEALAALGITPSEQASTSQTPAKTGPSDTVLVEDNEKQGTLVSRETPAPAGAASVGPFDESLVKGGEAQQPQGSSPLAMPELVAMVRDVSGGEIPIQVVRKLRAVQAAGAFSEKTGLTQLRADLMEKPKQAAATMAHEVGHWVDYLPHKTLKRGNILGHIAGLNRHMKGFLQTPSGKLSNKKVRSELWELSKKWRPMPEVASKKFETYRKKATELYADAFSVLVNNPELLAKEAPQFTRAWEDHLNARPEVAKAWADYQVLVKSGPQAVEASRVERVRQMVEKGDALRQQDLLERQSRNGQTLAQALADGMIDRASPLYRRVREARKKGLSLDPDANPTFWVEELPYFSSEASAYLALGQRQVLDILKASKVSPTDFGALLGLRRAAGERAQLFNPLGISGEEAQSTYRALEKDMGPEKAAAAQHAAEKFWELRKGTVITKLKELELLSPELFEKIETNAGYVRYQVQKFIEESGSLGEVGTGALREQIGTLQEIGNPLVETMLTDLALIRMAHRNAYARRLVEFEQMARPEEVTEAKKGPQGRFAQPTKRGDALVVYLHKGKSHGFYLPKELADTVDIFKPQNKIYDFWMKWAQNPFRTMVIERSLPFAIFNLPRDFQSVYQKIVQGNPISAAAKTIQYFAKAAPHAWQAAIKESLPDLEISMLERREIVPPGERFYKAPETTEETAIQALLTNYGLFAADSTRAKRFWQQVDRWLDKTPFSKRPGAFTERWAKMAARLYLDDHQEEMGLTDREVSHLVRTHGGTPDFYRRGKWFRLYNSIMPFSNVGKEGWRSDLEIGFDPKTRSEYWQRRALWTLGPKLAMYAAVAGLIGEPLKRLFARIPEHDLRNYMIIPWGFTKDGKAAYTRVPYDHFGQFLSNILWSGLTSTKKPEEMAGQVLESIPYSPAAIHPYAEVGIAASQYVSGRNPYDGYHGRTIVSPWIWEPQGPWSPESMKQFAKWSWNTVGGRLLLEFRPEDLKPKGAIEEALQFPILGPTASRLLKITDYGLYEEANTRLAPLKKKESDTSLARRRIIEQNLLSDNPLSLPELHREMAGLKIQYRSIAQLKNRIDQIEQQMKGGLDRLKASASKEELKVIEKLEKEMEAP